NLIIIMPLFSLALLCFIIQKETIVIAVITLFILIFIINFLKSYLILVFVHGLYRLKEGEKYEYWKNITNTKSIKEFPIFVIPIESKTKYLNAIALGIGNIDWILCYDTLINNLTKEQFAAIMAHETAHILNNDILKRLLFIVLIIALYTIYTQLFFLGSIYIILLTIFLVIVAIFGLKFITKRNQTQEFKADEFAAKLLKDKESVIESLTLIHEINQYPREHKKKGSFRYHPTLNERIENINNLIID
ncbi:MAG: M48 family metallopeptidase, partial [Vampirovibrionia bacterium]